MAQFVLYIFRNFLLCVIALNCCNSCSCGKWSTLKVANSHATYGITSRSKLKKKHLFNQYSNLDKRELSNLFHSTTMTLCVGMGTVLWTTWCTHDCFLLFRLLCWSTMQGATNSCVSVGFSQMVRITRVLKSQKFLLLCEISEENRNFWKLLVFYFFLQLFLIYYVAVSYLRFDDSVFGWWLPSSTSYSTCSFLNRVFCD